MFILLETPESERDPGLSEATREAVIGTITSGAPGPSALDPKSVATTLHALLPNTDGLTDGERHLLAEWLDRIVRSHRRIESPVSGA